MLTLLREGGTPVWFTILFGAISLGVSVRYLQKMTRAQLALLVGMSLATLFSILCGVAANLSAVGHHAPEYLEGHPDVPVWAVLSLGVAEALSPAILGFTLLSLSWLIGAVGLHRAARLEAATRS
jgi:hypothetical protein